MDLTFKGRRKLEELFALYKSKKIDNEQWLLGWNSIKNWVVV